MYKRAWCKSYINALIHGENQEGSRIFLSGPGGDKEKSRCTSHTKRHAPRFQIHSET